MAKRFRFPLEPVLRVRKAKEDEQRRVVAERVRETQRNRELLADFQQRVAQTLMEARRTRGKDVVEVGMELQEQRWRMHLQRRIGQTLQRIEESEESLAAARVELAGKSKDVKAIDKLRERRWQAHRKAQARAERLEADEVAAQIYIRQSARAGPFVPSLQTGG